MQRSTTRSRVASRAAAIGTAVAVTLAGAVLAAPAAVADAPSGPSSIDQILSQASITTWCDGSTVKAAIHMTAKAGTAWSTGHGSVYAGPYLLGVTPAGSGTTVGYSFSDVELPEGSPVLDMVESWESATLHEGDEVVLTFPGTDFFGTDDGVEATLTATLACQPTTEVYRFWSPKFNNAHFFTTDLAEAANIAWNDDNWHYEGIAFDATPASGGTCSTGSPVFRFYSPVFQSHFYTQDTAERDHIIAADRNWNYEGVSYCASPTPTPGSTALYRFWSPTFGKHFFTADQGEADHIRAVDRNWNYEGIAYYVQAFS